MLSFIPIFLMEAVICSIVMHPTGNTDTSVVSFLLTSINILTVLVLVSRSLRQEKDARIRRYVLWAYFIRVCILLWDVFMRDVFVLPNGEGDAVWYPAKAESIAFGARMGLVDYEDFSYYVALLYQLMGVQKITVQFLHVYYGIWSVLLINRILTMLDTEDRARRNAVTLACFLPNLMMIMTFFLYESLVSLLVIGSLYWYTLWWKGYRTRHFFVAILLAAAAGIFHVGGLVAAIGYVIAYPLVKRRNRVPRFSFSSVFQLALMVILVFGFLLTFGDTYLKKVGGSLDLETIEYRSSQYEAGGSVYTVGISGLGTTADFIVNTPIRIFSFLAAPLPWMWRSVSDVAAFFGSTVFFLYVWKQIFHFFAHRGYYRAMAWQYDFNYGMIFVLIVIAIIAGVMFGWGVANAGSALRHREKYTYVYIVLLALLKNIRTRSYAVTMNYESAAEKSP